MGNLNRAPRKFLVNSLDQTKFGMYTDADGNEHFVDKENGIDISDSTAIGAPEVMVGYGEPENLETIALRLYAPYPADTVDWLCELNLTGVPNKSKGGYVNHEELSRVYSGKVDSLDSSSTAEVTLADKLIAIEDIVKGINHDELRIANAGMAYIVKNLDSTSASTLTITLEDGSTHTVTSTGATGSLSATINADANLNTLMVAYAPLVSNNAAGDITIILPTLTNPSWFLVEGSATATVLDAYLMLAQQKEDIKMTYGGGATTTKWENIPYYMTAGVTSSVSADNGNVTVTVDGTATNLNVASGTAAAKALETAQLIGYFDTTIDKADTDYITALNSATGYTTVAFGPQAFALSNTAGTDLTVFTVSDFSHTWSTEYIDENMFHLFPNLPQYAYQRPQLPVEGKRYFKVKVKFYVDGENNTVFDGITNRHSTVEWYFNEDLMPATVTAATGEYWTDGTNMMSDTILGTEDSNIAQLINKVFTSAIVDADLA